jgi:hypothetical protein
LLNLACCGNEGLTIDWTLQHSKNERNHLKSQDNVLLKISFGKNTIVKNLTLRSHENNFKIDNSNYQEVFVHENRIGGIDEVRLLKKKFCNFIVTIILLKYFSFIFF